MRSPPHRALPLGSVLLLLLFAGCQEEGISGNLRLGEVRVEVDEDSARELVSIHGCGSCHVIPDIHSARGEVGPPLEGLIRRAYLAGILPNTYDNLVQWVMQPQAIDPDTAMPDMGLSREEAEQLAAFLYTR